MGVKTLRLPDYPNQLDATDYAANAIDPSMDVVADLAGQFAPHQTQPVQDMRVFVDPGRLFESGVVVTKGQQNTAPLVAPTTNDRIDRVAINKNTGDIVVVAGTEAASPSPPALTADLLPCCQVRLTPGMTEITNTDLTNERDLRHLGSIIDHLTTTSTPELADKLVIYDDNNGDERAITPGSFFKVIDLFTEKTSIAPEDKVALYSNADNGIRAVSATLFNELPRGAIDGLITSQGSDPNHYIDIDPGVCRSSDDGNDMKLSAALTGKRIHFPWAVGNNQGAWLDGQINGANTVTFNDNGGSPDDVTIDAGTWTVTPKAGDTLRVEGGVNAGHYQITGTPTSTVIQVPTGSFTADAASASDLYVIPSNDTLHGHLILRPDTGVVDFGVSTSLTPTLPANYTRRRRIASFRTDGVADLIDYLQIGDNFYLDVPVQDRNATVGTTAAVLVALSVPTGISVGADVHIDQQHAGVLADVFTLMTSPLTADAVPTSGRFTIRAFRDAGRSESQIDGRIIPTNTAGQVRIRSSASSSLCFIRMHTYGWIDRRGKDE